MNSLQQNPLETLINEYDNQLSREDALILLKEFKDYSKNILWDMLIDLKEKKWNELSQKSHALKGVSINLRLKDIFNHALIIENLIVIKDYDIKKINESLIEIKKWIEQIEKTLNE